MNAWLPAFALAFALASLGAGAQNADDDLQAVAKRLNALDSWIDDAGKRLSAQQKQVANADRDVAVTARRIRGLTKRIRDTAAAVERLRDEGGELERRRDSEAASLANHLRHAWRSSSQNPVKLLLTNEDPVVNERMMRYLGYVAEARADAVRALRETTAAAQANRRQQEAQQRDLEAARKTVAAEQDAFVEKRRTRRGAVASLRSELARKGKERERLAADRERLEKLVAELARRAKAATARRDQGQVFRATGGLVWPVDGRLTRRFGQARAGGRMRWQGIYLQAPLGTEVYAISGGSVVFADWLRGFGMLLIVDHGGGRLSLYGHADALFKRVGDRVEPGETIASVGQSGGRAEAGLYLEVRQNGKAIDPLGWLRPARG